MTKTVRLPKPERDLLLLHRAEVDDSHDLASVRSA